LTTKTNLFPLAKWNAVCYYDSLIADLYPSANADDFISMFDISNFTVVGVNEQTATSLKSSDCNLYPNPSNGIFTIAFNGEISNMVLCRVVNVLGQEVYYSEQRVEDKSIQLNLIGIQKGIYFLKVLEGNKSYTTKVIVQ
jgi:hypothetical protein